MGESYLVFCLSDEAFSKVRHLLFIFIEFRADKSFALWYFILIIVVSVDVYGQLIGGRVVVRGFAEDLFHGLFELVDAGA